MKKLFTLIAMVAITLMSYAQNQVFWSNGEILFATPVKGMDSLNYVDNLVASDTLQLILPHRLVEKPVNAEALNQTVTGEKEIWDFFAPADTYYNAVHINVDLSAMKAAHAADIKNLKDTIGEKNATIAEKEKEILAKDSTISAKNADIKNLNDTIGEKETIIADQKEVIDSIIDKYSKYTGEYTLTVNDTAYSFFNNDLTILVQVKPDTVPVEVHDTTIVTVEVEKIVEVQVPVYNCVGGLGYVDLGLPSGTLWASANVGAENPWEFGEYFSWGEIDAKEQYSIDTYLLYKGAGDDLKANLEEMVDDVFADFMKNLGGDLLTGNVDITKLFSSLTDAVTDVIKPQLEEICSSLTAEGNLAMCSDAATMAYGKKWAMPTKEQIQELIDNCEWTYGKMEGVDGWTVTGSNGNSIFLPAAGMKMSMELGSIDLGALTDKLNQNAAHYWSATNAGISAYSLSATYRPKFIIIPEEKKIELVKDMMTYAGKPIRPVYVGK